MDQYTDKGPVKETAVSLHLIDKSKHETPHGETGEEGIYLDREETFPFSISSAYVKDWDTAAAFRELYQNWKDAILERFGLDRLDFQPFYDEQDDYVSVIVPETSDRGKHCRALGFIKYDKLTGRVTIANSCAHLKHEDLEIGHSSKRENANLAGCHGEGLKLAALAMLRNGYSMGIKASNTYWNFLLGGSGFHCQLQQFKGVDINTQSEPASDMAQLRSHIGRDVTVVIEGNNEKEGNGISLAIFQRWLKVSLDIRGFSYPPHILQTDAGDLILDLNYQGKIYLKGMLLPAANSELKPYRLGYNFPRGRVNRDRQILVDSYEEADIVRRIWEAAIRSHEDVVLPIYINLLRNFPEAPDVGSADQLLEKRTRKLIWKHLLRDAKGKVFYYSQTSNPQSIGMVREVLKKEPTRLPETLWGLLRSVAPIRTPEEEQNECFRNLEVCAPPRTCFARTVQRALQACLAVFPRTAHVQVQFIQSDKTSPDAFFDLQQGVLKVHQRWLDFTSMHGTAPCRDLLSNEVNDQSASFFCEHVVEDLLRIVLPTLWRPSIMAKVAENKILLNMRNMLRYMPHSIEVIQTSQGLVITWEDNETSSFRKYPTPKALYHVVLHEENCIDGRIGLLHGDAANCSQPLALCGCPHQFASQMEKIAVFANLQSFKPYYPMIALNRPHAFYGLPPPSVIPNAIFASTNQADRSHSLDQHLYSRLSSADSMQPRSLKYQQMHQQMIQSQVLQMSQATEKRHARDSQEEQEVAQSKRSKNA